MSAPKKPKQEKPQQPNFWGMLRDVLLASISKGQFPMAMGCLIAIVMILKMPAEDVSKLVFQMLKGVEEVRLVGYLTTLVALTGWFYHARWQRKMMAEEVNRIAGERNKLQANRLGSDSVESSKKS